MRIVDIELGLLLLALLVASVALFQVRSAAPQLPSAVGSSPTLPRLDAVGAPDLSAAASPPARRALASPPASSPPGPPAGPRRISSPSASATPPPTRPADWVAKDAEVARIVVLSRRPPSARAGEEPCACGGVWRYTLGGTDTFPIWRCLHCGGLHSGGEAIPWD